MGNISTLIFVELYHVTAWPPPIHIHIHILGFSGCIDYTNGHVFLAVDVLIIEGVVVGEIEELISTQWYLRFTSNRDNSIPPNSVSWVYYCSWTKISMRLPN